MSVTPLRPRRPRTTGCRQVVSALLPVRMAHDFRQYAAKLRSPTAEVAGLVLADFVLKLRRERTPKTQRSAILSALEQAGCTFRGSVEPRHRTLARQLEKIDAKVSA